ncbi:hypothetical protein P7K49_010107 [Saguinus oedipus]|uniref:GMEB1/2/Spe-44-like domain-containing protein n=1 Tax=Saguinus oedipus TaxID=9490 RepID=A0ABQ9VMK3_SAGOE|nr:hypothetical protein P7K49_010107 [Saguinus oedipus]
MGDRSGRRAGFQALVRWKNHLVSLLMVKWKVLVEDKGLATTTVVLGALRLSSMAALPDFGTVDVSGQCKPSLMPGTAGSSVVLVASLCGNDTFTFWRGLKDAGLLDEVIQEFHQELMETMRGLQQRAQDPPLQLRDAVLLNNIVQNFGMLDLVKKVLASHKCQMDRSREQYARDLAGTPSPPPPLPPSPPGLCPRAAG